MKRIAHRRPSPALVIACIALFVALGGSSYAALTIGNQNVRNNSISGAKLTNGSVGATAKLKSRTITAPKVKRRSLAGNLFQQDSIGPNAVKEQALDAAKLGKVKQAEDAEKVAGIEIRRVESFDLQIGGTRGIATVAPFTITAHCREDGGNHIAEVVAQTNQNGSAVAAATDAPQFDIGSVARLVGTEAPAGTPAFAQTPGVAIAPNGATVYTDGLYAGASILGSPNQCRFGGLLGIG